MQFPMLQKIASPFPVSIDRGPWENSTNYQYFCIAAIVSVYAARLTGLSRILRPRLASIVTIASVLAPWAR